MEPVPILTVGDPKSELNQWSDETPVKFYSPLKEQEFRSYRYRSLDGFFEGRLSKWRRQMRFCPASSPTTTVALPSSRLATKISTVCSIPGRIWMKSCAGASSVRRRTHLW